MNWKALAKAASNQGIKVLHYAQFLSENALFYFTIKRMLVDTFIQTSWKQHGLFGLEDLFSLNQNQTEHQSKSKMLLKTSFSSFLLL